MLFVPASRCCPVLGEVVRRAATELKPSTAGRAPVTTLNGPTGGRRQLAVTRADLAGLRHTARAHGATINDVVLTAITGGVAALLDRRGQPVDHLVVSVPVSARSSAIASDLGNRVGVMPVRLPITGNRIRRLEKIAIITRAHKGTQRGRQRGSSPRSCDCSPRCDCGTGSSTTSS